MGEAISLQKNWCESRFALIEAKMNGLRSSPFHATRTEALSKLVEQGFPTQKMEAWKYSNVLSFAKPSFVESLRPAPQEKEIRATIDAFHLDSHVIVFSNGKLREEFCRLPTGVRLTSLFDAAKEKHPCLAQFWNNADEEANFISLMNKAFVQSGALLEIPEGMKVEKPIAVYHISNFDDADCSEHVFLGIHCGANAEASILEFHECVGQREQVKSKLLMNPCTRIHIEKEGKLSQFRIIQSVHGVTGLSRTSLSISEAAEGNTFVYSSGADFQRNEIEVSFRGEHARAGLYGLSALQGKEQVDNFTTIHHAVPNCESIELYKGVYAGESKGAFSGTIIVSKDAQKTNAIQNNQGLLLSRDAEVNARPTLKIWADDVKCTHGATVGELDENALFYLRSRGVPLAEARDLLVRAFLAESLSTIQESELQEQLLKHAIGRVASS